MMTSLVFLIRGSKSKILLRRCKIYSYISTEKLSNNSFSIHQNLCSQNHLSQRFIPHTNFRKFHISINKYQEIKIVSTPPFADSISEGDVKWQKAVGDSVKEDDIVCEIETDKTSIPVPAPAAGVIEELLVEDGGKVVAAQQLFKIKVGATAASTSKPTTEAAPPPKAQPVQAPAAASPSPPAPAPPAPKASGPIPTSPPKVSPPPSKPISVTPTASVKVSAAESKIEATMPIPRSEHRIKMNRMRLRIAQRLKEAQNTCAMLTTFNEIDMSNVTDLREKYKEAFLKKHGIKLGFMSSFLKASAVALKDQPAVNAVIDEADILYRDYVDISVAVATPKGLVVPVLRNVESMNCAQIEKALFDIGEKAKRGELAIEDMDGGTFTISNGGVFGSLMGTPIINPPQSAILGMHGIFERPVAIKGQVVIRPMMYVALTYDHRLIDGREAVMFLRKVKAAVEDPRTILLDL